MIDIKYNGNETVYIQTEEQKISTLYSSLTCTWELAYIIAKEGIEINFNFENATYEEILDLKECIEKTKTQETDKIIKICGDSDNEYRVKIKTEYTSKGIIKQTYKDNEYKLQTIKQITLNKTSLQKKNMDIIPHMMMKRMMVDFHS